MYADIPVHVLQFPAGEGGGLGGIPNLLKEDKKEDDDQEKGRMMRRRKRWGGAEEGRGEDAGKPGGGGGHDGHLPLGSLGEGSPHIGLGPQRKLN